MNRHAERVGLAETLGFSAVWLRDVPFNVPSFGDAGQIFDPFTYLGFWLRAPSGLRWVWPASCCRCVTRRMWPRRRPAWMCYRWADHPGVASGDRPQEYPALALPFDARGARFRDSFEYIEHMGGCEPKFDNTYGMLAGDMDMLPKPVGAKLPMLITGAANRARTGSQVTAPAGSPIRARSRCRRSSLPTGGRGWRRWAARPSRRCSPLYIDLCDDPGMPPQTIHLGFRLACSIFGPI